MAQAGLLFDGMPPPAAVDRLGALLDELLHRVLSCLPSEDDVRTCVLARHWRHLWKSATSLHIERKHQPDAMKATWEFVDHLLRLRRGAPIDTCVLNFCLGGEVDYLDDDVSRFKRWIQHILMCGTRVLDIDINRINLPELTLISNHLKIINLCHLILEDELVDFSSCPVLKKLGIYYCDLHFHTISSSSLKHLEIFDNPFPTCFTDMQLLHFRDIARCWLPWTYPFAFLSTYQFC